MKDMGDGSGTFIKIEEPTILQSGTVICIGESHIVVGLIEDSVYYNKEKKNQMQVITPPPQSLIGVEENPVSTWLLLKFIRGTRAQQAYKFIPEDTPIYIGRSYDCQVQVASDENLSKYHSQIDFVDDKWILRDGIGYYQSDLDNSFS